MRFSILTLFPEFFESPLKASLFGRAVQSGALQVDCLGLREFGDGKHRVVDDSPYGGGPGMVLMPQVVERALTQLLGSEEALQTIENKADKRGPHVVYLSPQGAKLTAAKARDLASKHSHLVVLCGHYEGVDERILEAFVHEEISIGDYVLTGGEPAALVLLDAISRFIPGVVGEGASVESDTFEAAAPDMVPGGLKYPMYTRPASWRGRAIPEVLASGNHGAISKWRRAQSEARTKARRPDLIVKKDH